MSVSTDNSTIVGMPGPQFWARILPIYGNAISTFRGVENSTYSPCASGWLILFRRLRFGRYHRLFLMKSVTRTGDVKHRRVVQEPVEDRRRDNIVPEYRSPLCKVLVAG